MKTTPTVHPSQPGLRLVSLARALLAVLTLAALAVPTRSLAQTPTFGTLVTTSTGNPNYEHPNLAGVGDFNGDGKLDALISTGSENLRLMLGNGNGTFTQLYVNTPGAGNQYAVRVADLNGDGRLDAITASNQGNLAAAVLINTGNLAGVPQFTVTNYTNPGFGTSGLRSLTIGDLNGGKPDFIVGNAHGALRVWLNNGDGTFTGGQYYAIQPITGGPSTGPGVIVDLNGDGKGDFLESSGQAAATNVFFGNGDGTLQAPVVIQLPGRAPGPIAAADLNNDGKPDFVEALSDGSLAVFLNNGNGTFGAPISYQLPPTGNPSDLVYINQTTSVAIADINGDGELDLVAGYAQQWYASYGVAMFTGNGDGTFGPVTKISLNGPPLDVSVNDFNGDGKPDIARVGYNDNTYGVLTNTTPPAITPLVNGTRTTTDGEAWTRYSTTFTPTITGNYTLKFFIPPDNTAYANSAPTIYLDDVRVTSGATELFRSGFENPVIASGGFTYFTAPNYSTGSVTAGDWVYYSTSGIINGAGLAWDSNHTAREGNQRAFLQAAPPSYNRYGAITTASTMALTAGQTYTATFWQASRTGTGLNSGTLTYAVAFNYVPPPPLFFTDAMTASSPNLSIPAAKYGPTVGGLRRNQSDNRTDRPMVFTNSGAYLTAANFTADLTVTLANDDLLYFGLGQGDADSAYFNEPSHAFYFRVHSRFDGHSYDIHAAVRSNPTSWHAVSTIGTYSLGSTITLRITRAGDTITLGIVGGGSTSHSLSAYQVALGLTNSNTRIFFGNTTVGSLFTNLRISSDTTPPVISSPGDLIREATSAAGAVATFSATAEDNVDGTVPVYASPVSGSTFPINAPGPVTAVGLSAADTAGNTATASFLVTVVDTTPPTIGAAPAVTPVEATGPSGATVNFTLPSATDIVDGSVAVTASPASGSTFAIGNSNVTLSARDTRNNSASKTFSVTVQDTTAPVISSLTASSASLWPANHKMVAVTVSGTATDAVTAAPSLKIISATSNEPDNGLGDGDTAGDIVITGNLTLNLRAERGGGGNGRIYTITVEAKDAAGNASTRLVTVTVPKSQGK